MITNEPITQGFAEFLLVEIGMDTVEYGEYLSKAAPDSFRVRTNYAKAYPFELYDGMRRIWCGLHDNMKEAYLQDYDKYLTGQEARLKSVLRILAEKRQAQEAPPLLPSKLFIITLVNRHGHEIRVAVRSHSHDGARTRLYASDWWKGWLTHGGSQVDRDTSETDLPEQELEDNGVYLVATDEEVVKSHVSVQVPPAATCMEACEENLRPSEPVVKPLFGHVRPPQPQDARPWYAQVAIVGSDGTAVDMCKAHSRDEAEQVLTTRQRGDDAVKSLHVLALLTSASEITPLSVAPPAPRMAT